MSLVRLSHSLSLRNWTNNSVRPEDMSSSSESDVGVEAPRAEIIAPPIVGGITFFIWIWAFFAYGGFKRLKLQQKGITIPAACTGHRHWTTTRTVRTKNGTRKETTHHYRITMSWTFKSTSYSETWTENCARAGHAYHLACSNSLNTVVVLPEDPAVVSLECLVFSAWGDSLCAFFGTGCLVSFSVFAGFSLQDDPSTAWPIALPIVAFFFWLVGGFPWPRALLAVQNKERVYADCNGQQMNAAQFKELMLQPGQVKTLDGNDNEHAPEPEFERGVELDNMLFFQKRVAEFSFESQQTGATAPAATQQLSAPPYPSEAASNPLAGGQGRGPLPYPTFGGPPPYYGAPPAAYPPGATAFASEVPAEYLEGGAYDPTPEALASLSGGASSLSSAASASPRSPRDKLKSAVTKVIAATRLMQGSKRAHGARPQSDLWGTAFGQPQFSAHDVDMAVAGMAEGASVQDSSPPPTLMQFRTTLAIMGVLPAVANFWLALRQRLLSATDSAPAVKALRAMKQLAEKQAELRNTTIREDVLHVAATSAGCKGGDGGAAATAVRELVAALEE